jgi:hypothetical protein
MTFASMIGTIVDLLNEVVQLLMIVSLLGFIWGLVRFTYNSGDEAGRKEGKQIMVWGTVALFGMTTVWGLVEMVKTIFFN